jgi:hypothetical protein
MPAQRITFSRMTTALALLVLLGFGVAGPATALQFDGRCSGGCSCGTAGRQ